MIETAIPFEDSPNQAEVWRAHGQRNFNLGVYNGVLYIFAETLLDPTLVLVAFVSHLTQSPILLGLVIPIRDGAWSLPQLWVSTFLQSLPRKLEVYKKLSFLRISLWLCLALTINFISNPTLQLTLFFTVLLLANLASGLSGLPFLEVVSKTIPPRKRGQFYGYRFGFGGALGVGGSLFVRWILDTQSPFIFPHNFGVLAGIYFVISSISLLLYHGVVEPPDTKVLPRVSFTSQFKRGWQVIRRDDSFRKYFILSSMLTLAGSATPFFAVYVQRELGGPTDIIAVYLAVTLVVGLIGNLLFGKLSYQIGYRRIMVFASLIGIAMSALVLVFALIAKPLGLYGLVAAYSLIPIYVLSSLRNTAVGVCSSSLLLEIAPKANRSIFIGFTNTLLGVVILAGGMSGLAMNLVGFVGLNVLALAAHLIALWTAQKISITL